MQPNPAAAGFGQLVLLAGTDMPGSNIPFVRPDIWVTQGGSTYQGFVLNRSDTHMQARLPTSGLVPGAADVQVSEPGAGSPRSAPFGITISNTPGAPQLLASFDGSGNPSTTLIPNGTIQLQAIGVDTSDIFAVFRWGVSGVATATSYLTYSSGPTFGFTGEFTVPATLPENSAINVTVYTTVNGVDSPESNTLVLQVPIL
jgi:hypothetical protein